MKTKSAPHSYKIAVAGTGYVGLSLAVLLSQHNEVTAVDILPEKIEKLNNYEESNKPSKSGRSSKTGDSANGALWALLLLMAGGALGGTVWYKRRKKV